MTVRSMAARPALFIGSSSESLPVARALQSLLDHDAEVTIWTDGIFGPGGITLLSLLQAVKSSDFAALVVDADDSTETRGVTRSTTRDNVVFEMGLFLGHLGVERCFMIHDRSKELSLPTDLNGVTSATYQPHTNGEFESALGAAANSIRKIIQRLGIRESRLSESIGSAATSLASSKMTLDRAVFLLARSRAVELDIIANQFGVLIDSERLASMRRDLADLLSAVAENEN